MLAMGISGFLLFSLLQTYFITATERSLIAQAQITAQVLIPDAVITAPPIESQTAFTTTLQQNQIENLTLQATNLSSPDSTISSGNLLYLQDVTLQLGAQINTRIRILDSLGTVIVDSLETDVGTSYISDELVTRALRGEVANITRDTSEGHEMLIALPAYVDDELISIIFLSQPLNDIYSVLADLRTRWVYAITAASILAGIGGLILSNAITNPISRLTKASQAVAYGDFTQYISSRSDDEIGTLGRTFNDMTNRLRVFRQTQIDFVANVSHELRTPLTSIKGMIETLRNGAVEDLTVRDHFLHVVENETDRMIRLVNDLLILSQADSDSLDLHREEVPICDLIKNTIETLKPLAEEKNLTFVTQPPPESYTARVDRDRITQVLFNLLDNAVKYSQAGGTITLTLTKSDFKNIRIQVQDEGIGIPEESLRRLGERFYRSDKARSRTLGGSGLGLAIAQTLVQAHGGQLILSSIEGQGTTATVTLPISNQLSA
jgi:signal transduction histidine kinase